MGKEALARWDAQQKDRRLQQHREEQHEHLLKQQQVPFSSSGLEQQFTFGRHGLADVSINMCRVMSCGVMFLVHAG